MELWKKNWALIRMFFGGCFHRSQKPGDANRSWLDLIPKRWVLSRLQPLISGHVSLNHPKKVTFSLIIAMEVCPSLVGNRLRKGNKVDSCDSHFQTGRWFWNFKGPKTTLNATVFPSKKWPALLRDYQAHHDFGDGTLAIKITQWERKVIWTKPPFLGSSR